MNTHSNTPERQQTEADLIGQLSTARSKIINEKHATGKTFANEFVSVDVTPSGITIRNNRTSVTWNVTNIFVQSGSGQEKTVTQMQQDGDSLADVQDMIDRATDLLNGLAENTIKAGDIDISVTRHSIGKNLGQSA